MKTYRVSVNIKWTDEYIIKAKSKVEAKKKGIDRFRKKKSNFEADAYVWD